MLWLCTKTFQTGGNPPRNLSELWGDCFGKFWNPKNVNAYPPKHFYFLFRKGEKDILVPPHMGRAFKPRPWQFSAGILITALSMAPGPGRDMCWFARAMAMFSFEIPSSKETPEVSDLGSCLEMMGTQKQPVSSHFKNLPAPVILRITLNT